MSIAAVLIVQQRIKRIQLMRQKVDMLLKLTTIFDLGSDS